MSEDERTIVATSSDDDEKMLPQSEVNDLIGMAKAAASKKTRKQVESEMQKRFEDVNSANNSQQPYSNASNNLDPNIIVQQAVEAMNKKLSEQQEEQRMKDLEEHITQVAQSYNSKMMSGKDLYDDFEEISSKFDPREFKEVVYLVGGMDDAAHIMYELLKNKHKLATIDHFARNSPTQARKELEEISNSLKRNKDAYKKESNSSVYEPLDRMTPSAKTGGNGRLSISDLKKQPWLQG